MAAKRSTPKRLNRAVKLGDMVGRSLDPALKKRGFANRDLVANWRAIAPAPYDRVALPDRLAWPRRNSPSPEGAVLYLRCLAGHGLALAHESETVAAAINRYFGYFLVGAVRLSPAPLIPEPVPEPVRPPSLPPARAREMEAMLAGVEDAALKDALERLGTGILAKGPRIITRS